MTGAMTPPERWPPEHFFRHAFLSVLLFVVAAAAFVSAVFLYTYCIPGTVAFGASGCVFPHQLAAGIFLGAGVLFLALGLVYGSLAWLAFEPERYQRLMAQFPPAPSRPPERAASAPEAETRAREL